MDRYPVVIYLGAGILGKVGGDMALTDPWVTGLIHISMLRGTRSMRRSSRRS